MELAHGAQRISLFRSVLPEKVQIKPSSVHAEGANVFDLCLDRCEVTHIVLIQRAVSAEYRISRPREQAKCFDTVAAGSDCGSFFVADA